MKNFVNVVQVTNLNTVSIPVTYQGIIQLMKVSGLNHAVIQDESSNKQI